jgi:hypothetical protein
LVGRALRRLRFHAAGRHKFRKARLPKTRRPKSRRRNSFIQLTAASMLQSWVMLADKARRQGSLVGWESTA